VKSSTSGTATFTATANGVEPVPGTASVTFYACVRVHAMAVGGTQQFLPFSIDNTTGLARRLIALEIIWPAGGNKRFTGVSLSGTTLWTGSANGSPITISGGDWIGGTDGARTVPNNPGSPLPMLQLSFNFPVVTSPPSQQFSVNTTWDDGNGGSLCSTNISVTR